VRVFRSLPELSAGRPARSVVAVGTFDGVHLGHAAVLREAVRWARELGATPAAVVFVRPPRSLLGRSPPDLLTSPEHRLRLVAGLGVELALELEFTEELARTSAADFCRGFLAEGLRAAGLVVGHDARMGRGGAGDLAELAALGRGLGFQVRQVGPVAAGGVTVSSSAVRQAVLDGNLPLAACLLGRRVSVLGTVVQGAGHGRELGFPTVNLDVHREVRPPLGVYATLARVEGGPPLRSVTNVGFRPTAGPPEPGRRRDLLVETHLLEGGADLYGRQVEVEFVARLRDERRFDSDRELSEQIARDAAEARRILESGAFDGPAGRA
jgi:riboflavin kinase/FMN adenylyltransferase